MFKLLFIFISIVLPISIFEGRVLDINDFPIADVNVQILETELGTSTDSEGYFFIGRSDMLITIKLSHIAYQSKIIKVNPSFSTMTIRMTENILQSERIVVTGTRSNRHIKDAPVLTHVIGQEDIRNSSYSNVKDILEMAMPNVQMVASNHGDDRVKIQGLANKYLTFLVDGDRISGEYAGNIDFSMLGLSNVDKIEVIEGAMSTLYGSGAVGGVVNIITRVNREPYWINYGLQYDNPIGLSQFINAGFNKGILNYNVNIQYADSKGYDLTPNDEGIYDMTSDENNSRILNHRLILSPSDKHILKFHFKDYSSRINKYGYTEIEPYYLLIDSPLNRYYDKYYNMKYDYILSSNQSFKISYIEEEYFKYYYYPYYYSEENQNIFNPAEFINGILGRQEINLQYNVEDFKYKRLIGLELYDEKYSSFNIYTSNGILLQSSIFESMDLTNSNNNTSLYFYEERSISNSRILSVGLRIQNLSKENIILPSLSYLIKRNNNYNYRISFSRGYREPSIKERYYKWLDHPGGSPVLGNPNLKSTQNNYFSISLDKRTSINDFSIDIYKNDIFNMISTEFDSSGSFNQFILDEFGNQLPNPEYNSNYGGLLYTNFDKVIISGINVHYYRKISDRLKLKFVYNLTDAKSNSNEILEGISKHALRINLNYKLSKNIDVLANIKYAGKKFIFDQNDDFVDSESIQTIQTIQKLSSYFISDLYSVTSFKRMVLKFGVKNILNYKDPNRLLPDISDILNNYDPGRRIFFELSLRISGGINDK